MIDNEVVTIGFSNSKGESMVFLAEKYVVIERSARKLGCTLPIVKSKLPPTFHYKWCESLISNKLNIGKLPYLIATFSLKYSLDLYTLTDYARKSIVELRAYLYYARFYSVEITKSNFMKETGINDIEAEYYLRKANGDFTTALTTYKQHTKMIKDLAIKMKVSYAQAKSFLKYTHYNGALFDL